MEKSGTEVRGQKTEDRLEKRRQEARQKVGSLKSAVHSVYSVCSV